MQGIAEQAKMSVSLVKMLASCGISPNIVENSEFQAFVQTVQSCPNAQLPTRHSIARDKGKNGLFLDMALQDARNDRERVMKDIQQQCIAGNIMADCAKSISRTTNVTLLKAFYRGHISTALMKHTTGSSVSKTGEWIFNDLRQVIESTAPGTVFIVILDGASACLKALRLLHEWCSSIFGHRCTLHGWNLCVGDLTILFKPTVKLFLRLILFINAHERLYTLLERIGGRALMQPAPTRMAKEAIALQSLAKDKTKIQQLFVHDEFGTILCAFKKPQIDECERLRVEAVFNEASWSELQLFLGIIDLPLISMRVPDTDGPTLRDVAEIYYRTRNEVPMQIRSKGLLSDQSTQEKLKKLEEQVVLVLAKREPDLVTNLARSAAYVNPKHVYADEPFDCPGASDSFRTVVSDYVDGTCEGNDSEKVKMKANMLLEAANFRRKRGWFSSDIAVESAIEKDPVDFWTIASEMKEAATVSKLAQLLLTCSSSQASVERSHKITARTRTKHSNRKLSETTEAYCEIATSEANKKERNKGATHKLTIMAAFAERIKESIRVRKEREEAAKAIASSRAETGSEESDNDDVHDGMEDLLHEVYDEAGLDSDSDGDEHYDHAW
jgi:hypothetical protein